MSSPSDPTTSAASDPDDDLYALGVCTDNPPLTLAERHQGHYRLCGCLGRSSTCCDLECVCHVLD